MKLTKILGSSTEECTKTITATNEYCFHDLPAGNYEICIESATGSLSTSPLADEHY